MPKSLFGHRSAKLRQLLVAARKERGLTQSELAVRLGRRQTFVSKYELGERRIDVIEFLDIARELDVDACKTLKRIAGVRD
jgi:transcriptional regulator with XRE-family HTH domain